MHDIVPSNSDETPQHPEGSKIAEGRNLPHKLCHLDYSYCLGNLGQHAGLAAATDRQRDPKAAMIKTVNRQERILIRSAANQAGMDVEHR